MDRTNDPWSMGLCSNYYAIGVIFDLGIAGSYNLNSGVNRKCSFSISLKAQFICPYLKLKRQDLNLQTPCSEADVTTSRANKLAQKLADF